MPAVMATAWCAHPETCPPAMSPSWLLQTWRNCNKFDLHCQGIRSAFGTHLQFNQHRHMFGFPCHHPFTCHFHQHFWSKAQLGFNSLWKSSKHPLPLAPFPSMLSTQVNRTVIARVAVFIETHSRVANHFGTSNNEGCVSSPLSTSSVFKNSVRHPRFQSFYSHGNKCQIREGGSLTCRQAPALVTGVTERRAPINPWWNGSAW